MFKPGKPIAFCRDSIGQAIAALPLSRLEIRVAHRAHMQLQPLGLLGNEACHRRWGWRQIQLPFSECAPPPSYRHLRIRSLV